MRVKNGLPIELGSKHNTILTIWFNGVCWQYCWSCGPNDERSHSGCLIPSFEGKTFEDAKQAIIKKLYASNSIKP